MEINDKESIIQTLRSPVSNAVERPANGTTSKSETAKPNSDLTRPHPPARRPPSSFSHAVTQSLTTSGIGATTTTTVPGTAPSDQATTANDQESGQAERVSQAMQAFMHTLVQAANSHSPTNNLRNSQSSSASSPGIERLSAGQTSVQATDSYTGLVSRLESLAKQIEGRSPQGAGGSEISELNNAFNELTTSTNRSGDGQGSKPTPRLEEVVRAVARNLQSTGDPTLATSGNVINTSA